MKDRIIILKPIITEKSMLDTARGVYTFQVALSAEKKEIKKEIEKLYKVHVLKIKTVKIKGKKKHTGKQRKIVEESDIKKARVKLATSEKIDIFDTGQAK